VRPAAAWREARKKGGAVKRSADEDDEVEGSEKRKTKEAKEGIPRVVQRERAVSRLVFLILTKPKALFQSLAH